MSRDHYHDLLTRYREGDETAYRVLVEEHVALLRRRLALRIPVSLRRRISASDVIQESCVVAFERRDAFEDRGENAFRNWLYGIADRKLKEAIRNHGRAARRAVAREVTRAQRPDTGLFAGGRPSPSTTAMSREVADAIRVALDQLAPEHSQVLRLALVEGLNLREVSERMGRSHDATRKLYGRAVVHLRASLTRDGVDAS